MTRSEEWGEDNGSTGRCPSCRRRIWVESGCVAECSCGWSSQPEEEAGFIGTPDCPSDCYDYELHVKGCPHGPDMDIPNDWAPDLNAETGRERHEREYREKYR